MSANNAASDKLSTSKPSKHEGSAGIRKSKEKRGKVKAGAATSSRGENQTAMMVRLILEGKTDEQIVAAFAARFTAQYGKPKDPKFVAKRCRLFRASARRECPEVRSLLEAQGAQAKSPKAKS